VAEAAAGRIPQMMAYIAFAVTLDGSDCAAKAAFPDFTAFNLR
jgi:hypothetical protein